MLEYAKTIVQKVSFNKHLLRKELGKAMNWLNPREREELAEWTAKQFGTAYADLFKEEKEEVIL